MTSPDEAAREVLVEACRRLDRLGLVHATAGNASMRLGPDLLVTPKGAALGSLRPGDLVRLPLGQKAAPGEAGGGPEPTSELPTHLALHALPGVAAVVHAHPPFATAFSFEGRDLPLPTDEARALLRAVPTVPYAPPGSEALAEAVAEAAGSLGGRGQGAVLLARHGALAWAGDLARAVALVELVEATAKLLCIRRLWFGAEAAGRADDRPGEPGT